MLSVINAVFRRKQRIARLKLGRALPRIIHKELVIDPMRRMVEMRKKPIQLTAKEFDVLLLLASKAGAILTKEEIYETVWKADCSYMSTNVSDHISTLRQKLSLDKKDQSYIQTVFGVGYRFSTSK